MLQEAAEALNLACIGGALWREEPDGALVEVPVRLLRSAPSERVAVFELFAGLAGLGTSPLTQPAFRSACRYELAEAGSAAA